METQKPRKVTSGPIREKARTMRRMVAAVGKVLKKKGYPGLTIANIAIEAQVDRKLVYSYYGSLDKLVGIYLREQDYWKTKAKKQISVLLKKDSISKQEMDDLLIGQFDAVLQDKILQRILQWELSEPNKALRMIADEREDVGEELLKKYEADLPNEPGGSPARPAAAGAGSPGRRTAAPPPPRTGCPDRRGRTSPGRR